MRGRKGSAVLSAALSAALAVSLCPALALADEPAAEGAQQPAAEQPAAGPVEEGEAAAAAEPAVAAEPQTQSAEPAAPVAESNELVISDYDGLVAFADRVNNGESFAGKTVKLSADIDLGNKAWTPIGLRGNDQGFCGTFDGQGHTISNLSVDRCGKEQAAGLFGSVRGILKNFTVANATVKNSVVGDDQGRTVDGTAVVVGCTGYGATIDNVHVVNATVESNRYVAGIAGYAQGTVTNCSVENVKLTATPNQVANQTYDNGDKVGGIVGLVNNGITISGCTLKGNVSITGYRDLGGIVGCVQGTSSITNNVVEANVSIVVDKTQNYKSLADNIADYNVDELIGRNNATNLTESGNSVGQSTFYARFMKGAFVRPVYVVENNPNNKGRTHFWGDLVKVDTEEPFYLEMYSGDTLVSTTKYVGALGSGPSSYTLNIVLSGEPSSSWETEWVYTVANAVPDRIVLIVDGMEVDSTAVIMKTDADGKDVDWASLDGVNPAPEEKPLPPAGTDGTDDGTNDDGSDVKPVSKSDGDSSKSLAKTGDSAGLALAGLGAAAVAAAGACAIARRRAE